MCPSNAEITSSEAALEYISDCLKTFLKIVFVRKDVDVKLASTRQAVMQATRPGVLMAPLQIGLEVQMHHHFQSKFLIKFLNSHGSGCYYDEVKRYERCASMTEHEIPKNYGPQNFLKYAADNVDHHIRILEGNKTFN